ncbi:MAG TPA: hypothetical protein PLH94_05715 [Fimbriimonadaceae bacterium]|nr:hypothetical protein [Fimbriimonadaceae bacterium]
MRRVVVVLPRAVSPIGNGFILNANCPRLQQLASRAELVKLSPIARAPTPEAAFFGLDPHEARIAPGPLAVAGLGLDPPDSSLQFHLSLLTTDGVDAETPPAGPTEEELQTLFEHVRRLETPNLIPAKGMGLDHALIALDGSPEVITAPPQALRPYRAHLPVGDDEARLRRFIDDSVNLLTPLEFNVRRIDEGLVPLNLLWPWGPGFRVRLPHLGLAQGAPTTVMSGSLRCAGIARLVGYRHLPVELVGEGINVPFEALAERIGHEPRSLLILRQPGHLHREGRSAEATWLMEELDRRLIGPVLDRLDDEKLELTVVAPTFEPDDHPGLAMTWTEPGLLPHHIPFDERAVEEHLPMRSAWSPVERALEADV